MRYPISLLVLLIPAFICAQNFEVLESTSLRSEATSKSAIIFRAKPGQTGQLISSEKWWSNVVLNGKTGYIKTAKIFVLEEPVVTENEPTDTMEPSPFDALVEDPDTTTTTAYIPTPETSSSATPSTSSADPTLYKLQRKLDETEVILHSRERELKKIHQLLEEEKNTTEQKTAVILALQLEIDSLQRALLRYNDESHSHQSGTRRLHSYLDFKPGVATFIEKDDGVSNGVDLELRYTVVNPGGFGGEVGINAVYLPELDGFRPFVNPFVGISFGKYTERLRFSVSPRVYWVTIPGIMKERQTDAIATTTRVVPSFFFGGSLNVQYVLNEKLALALYGNYMNGTLDMEETGTVDGVGFNSVTTKKLNVIGAGVGLSYSW